MDQGSDTLALAGEFPPATREQWRKLVDGVLKGAPFERLTHTTRDGLILEPLYSGRRDATPVMGRRGAWEIMQRADHPDPAKANAQALDDLENGATSLLLAFGGGASAYGYGLEGREAAIARALEGVYLDAVTIETDVSPRTKDAGQTLASLFKSKGIAPDKACIRLNYDPIGAMAVAGSTPMPWRDLAPVFAAMVRALSDEGFKGPFAAANGRIVHAAGGSEAQELAFVLANAVAYLRALEAGGIPLEIARGMIYFRLAADADQFLTMAKFRAMRKLWARVEDACGLAPKPAFISAETAWRMMTQRDVNVNMLRTTIAALAAGLGGADAISILPHTIALGLPDAFARRVARNTQLILLEESNLAKVSDPAAGSAGIEELTDKLCFAAWSLFQDIEAAGGGAQAVESGMIQEKVAAVRAERQAAVAKRKDAMTGTSDYPNIAELAASILPIAKASATPLPAVKAFSALAPMRLSEPFEKFRDASDAILASSGKRPAIALVELGSAADFTARANFAKNLFEAGGIETVAVADDTSGITNTGVTIACLCSSDEIYEREGAKAARSLAAAGIKHIYLAGRPKDPAPYTNAGITGFVYAGCDAVAVLSEAHAIIAQNTTRSGA